MKIQIEEIIKKNLPEKKEMKGITDYFDSDGGFNQALSQINTSLIADEVLKIVVEKIKEMDKSPQEEKFTEDKFENTENMNRVFMRVGYSRALKDLLSNLSHNK